MSSEKALFNVCFMMHGLVVCRYCSCPVIQSRYLKIHNTVPPSSVQSGAAGFVTGNGEKLSINKAVCLAGVAWVLLSFSPFPASNPVAPPCMYLTDLVALSLSTWVVSLCHIVRLASDGVNDRAAALPFLPERPSGDPIIYCANLTAAAAAAVT